MSRCRVCRKEWPSQVRVCPEDGAALGFETDRTMDAAQAALDTSELDADDLRPGATVGEYRVDAAIGKGGMGTVYAVTHPLIGKKAAIKVISRALGSDRLALERFVQEARAVNQIGHPNIVDIFSFGTLPDGRAYFVMEYLQGETLMARMARGGLSLGETSTILDQIADALEAAHEKGVVHRDLKPDNAFLVKGRGGRQIVKLLDFGIAKLAGTSDQRLQRTRTGTMMGTPGYISPEQARGRNVDSRTDVYSLGCMAFEMIIGRLPFDADNPMDMIAAHLTVPPPRPSQFWPEIPPALDQVLHAMIDKDPARRPTLAVVRAHLLEFGGTQVGIERVGGASQRLPVHTPPPGGSWETPPPQLVTPAPTGPPTTDFVDARPRPGRQKLLIAVGVASALTAAVIAIVVATGSSGSTPPPREPEATPAPSAPPASPAPEPAPSPTPAPVVAPAPIVPPAPTGGTLVITLNVGDATILLDGAVAADKTGGATLSIDADGEHDVEITAPGRKPLRRRVAVAGGQKVELPLRLERATRTTTQPANSSTGSPRRDGRKDTDYTIDPFRRKPK